MICFEGNKIARKLGFGVFGNGGDKEPAKKERFGVRYCIGGRTNTPSLPPLPPKCSIPNLSLSGCDNDRCIYVCKHGDGAVFVHCRIRGVSPTLLPTFVIKRGCERDKGWGGFMEMGRSHVALQYTNYEVIC